MSCPSSCSCGRTSKKALAVVAVLILFAITFVILKQRRSSAPSPSTNSSSSSVSSDAFSNWQPVNGPDHAWSLKLPPAFSLTFKSDSGNSIRFEKDQMTFELVTESTPSLKVYLDALDQERKTGYEGQPSVTTTKETEVTVDGQKASQREVFLNAAGIPEIETFVFVKGTIYLFATRFAGETSLIEGDRTLHQNILSTVKFEK